MAVTLKRKRDSRDLECRQRLQRLPLAILGQDPQYFREEIVRPTRHPSLNKPRLSFLRQTSLVVLMPNSRSLNSTNESESFENLADGRPDYEVVLKIKDKTDMDPGKDKDKDSLREIV